MGSALSSDPAGARDTDYVMSESETMSDASVSRDKEESESVEEFHDTIDMDDSRAKAKEEEMEEFKRQLNIKREQRRKILDRHKAEKEELEKSLEKEIKAKLESYETNRVLRELLLKNNIEIPENLQSFKETSDITYTIVQMKEEFEKFKSNNNRLRRDLAESNNALQSAYSDIADLNAQNTESIKQINALKEVISVSKTMINLREQQLNELKNKLNEIERSLADREANMLSADLRQEYERQLQNIRTLRGLYEERARLAEVTRQGLLREVEEQNRLKQVEIDKNRDLTTKLEELEVKVDELHERLENKNNQISSCQDETRGIQAEMSVVNKLFSQVLLGYKTKQDLDKLVHRLEENHGLLTHMAERENGSEASSALPKLLLELVSQVDEGGEGNNELDVKADSSEAESVVNDKSTEVTVTEPEAQTSLNTSAEEIVQNLPKVWRVLMELLSHQTSPEENPADKVTTCYKSVETKSGPVLVPSVSQTYIRLKDLIVEKLALIKEVNHMKQLNGHLETRLEEQERRLCLVTTELSKTWHVVGRLRRHHHQLHTHEKILKYELQQKRKLLNELKEELEYCREKWEQAREKNSQSERDLRKLRTEFASRKTKTNLASFNNSAESGYSDERPSDDSSESNDEREYVTEPLTRSKKKIKKSFEVLDSSTDLNLAAEREDPASDLLDVADLPLDTQDGDDNHESCVSDSYNSESLLKSEKVCEETEDEMAEIANDSSCVEELSIAERCESNDQALPELNLDKDVNGSNDQNEFSGRAVRDPTHKIPKLDPAAIMESIREQNERLAKRDKKLERLERSGVALLKQTQSTVEISKQIDSTLDHLINRPSSSRQTIGDEILILNENVTRQETEVDSVAPHDEVNMGGNIKENTSHITEQTYSEEIRAHKASDADTSSDSSNLETKIDISAKPTCSTDFEQQKSEMLQRSEVGCSEIAEDITNDENIKKSENFLEHKDGNSDEDHTPVNPSSRDGSEPSTSSELDHEARFAARDLRLKRLEEQTKSLVNKVNKTTTKGVKIHYKLEELHNIYGSENSRAGTPSEDNDDLQTNDNEDEGQDKS